MVMKIWIRNGFLVAFCGGLAALPRLVALPSGAWFERAAHGLSRETFSAQTGILDALAASLWRAGGPQGLAVLSWGEMWLGWMVALGAILGLGILLGRRMRGRMRRIVLGIVGLLCIAAPARGIWLTVLAWDDPSRDPRLWLPTSEALILSKAGLQVFASPSTVVPLVLSGTRPVLGPVAARQAMQTVPGWRDELRNHGWDAVLLGGNHGEPLLDHLLTAPDWRLASVSPVGWLFLRGAGPDAPLPKSESLNLGDPRATALALARLSARFDAMRAPSQARDAIERALELSPASPEVRTQAAAFAVRRKRWQDVISHSRAALRRDPGNASARALLGLGLLESGNANAAVDAAREAVSANPRDSQTLLLLARAQRAARDFHAEVRTLTRLVALLRRADQPTAACLSYLGQAHAQTGNAREAMTAYREALASGELNPEQATAVREALQVIESRSNYQTVEP